MEEAGLVCLGTCSKRCLKRLESGSKCHWLEMCLFFLIWWMALEGGEREKGYGVYPALGGLGVKQ